MHLALCFIHVQKVEVACCFWEITPHSRNDLIMVQQTKSIICFVKYFSGINVHLFQVRYEKYARSNKCSCVIDVLVRLAAVQNEKL